MPSNRKHSADIRDEILKCISQLFDRLDAGEEVDTIAPGLYEQVDRWNKMRHRERS